MFGLHRLINLIATIILTLLLTLLITATIVTYTTSEVISNRENLRTWLHEDNVRDSYINYVVDQTYSTNAGIILRGIIDEDEYEEIVRKEFSDEIADQLIDTTVDQVYDWLEGEKKTPQVSFSPINTDIDFSGLDQVLDEKIGFLGDFVDVEDILLFSDKIELINLEDFTLSNAPEVYQTVLSIPKKLVIASIIVAILILLSNRSWRSGVLLIGLAVAASSLFMLVGYKYIDIEQLIKFAKIPYGIDELPDLSSSPEFIRLIGHHARENISSKFREYNTYSLGFGILSVAISQLGIKEVEVENEADIDEIEEPTSE